MKTEKKTGLKGSLIVAGVCTLMLCAWNKQFGPVVVLLFYSFVRHGVQATLPDHRSFALLVLFFALYVWKQMIRSLQKDAWQRCKDLLSDTFVPPLA